VVARVDRGGVGGEGVYSLPKGGAADLRTAGVNHGMGSFSVMASCRMNQGRTLFYRIRLCPVAIADTSFVTASSIFNDNMSDNI
jgi:hypothetical protein